MKILVLNCGSSSLKFQLLDMSNECALIKGNFEELGKNSFVGFQILDSEKQKIHSNFGSHEQALSFLINELLLEKKIVSSLDEISAIGHRVVHGGEFFSDSVIVNSNVISVIKKCFNLAPLHNPANLMGIELCQKLMPSKKNIAVFDTAFHQTLSKTAFLYPIPFEYYEKYKIRKYGFHGISHQFISLRVAELLGKKVNKINTIVCHLGNGASITAIKKGISINTSMGFTPLAGLMMATRCGDIDPAILPYLMKKENLSLDEMENILNKKSGLLGLSKSSGYSRILEEEAEKGSEQAQIALDKFSWRVKECLGSYIAILNGVDAIVFTAGVGENSPLTREYVCSELDHIGIKLDKEKNNVRGKEALISAVDSKVKVFVIPTNEELMIARETKKLIEKN